MKKFLSSWISIYKQRQLFLLVFLIFTIAFILRFNMLGKIPISLHGDEIGVGYNAFTLLHEQVDENNKPFPLVLRADVGPLIFYSTIPSILLFGLSEYATRLPSAMIGLALIGVYYLLIREVLVFFGLNQGLSKLTLIATTLLSLSPWQVQISRIVHDAQYGLLFQFLGIWVFLRCYRKSKYSFWYLSPLFFALSFYAYHAPRITSPLLFLGLAWITYKKVGRRRLLYGTILFVTSIVPLAFDFFSKPFSQTRFGGINIFIGEGSRFFLFPFILTKNWIAQYDPFVLFVSTEHTRYFNLFNVGLLPIYYIPLIFLGLFYIFLKKKSSLASILYVILIAVIPGALTQGPVNTGRISLLLPVLDLIASVGLWHLLLRGMKKLKLVYVTVIMFFVATFLNQYFNINPYFFSQQWQEGAREISKYALSRQNEVENIIISDSVKQGYLYILFYGEKSIKQIYRDRSKPIKHPHIGYQGFENFQFRPIQWEHDKLLKNSLIIGPPSEIPVSEGNKLFLSRNGEILYVAVRTRL